jgi:hypothetical protein
MALFDEDLSAYPNIDAECVNILEAAVNDIASTEPKLAQEGELRA